MGYRRISYYTHTPRLAFLDFLAERAEEAIAKLRDAKPAHNSKGRGRDPYEAAILRAEKARRRADGP
jgi:hypothetical protein